MTPHPAIHLTDVTRRLPLGDQQINILKGISLAIQPGEWVALTGPSGSGKSTLLGLIAGLDSPTSGQIALGGTEIATLDEGRLAQIRNERVGVVFQSFNLIPALSALENVELPLFVSHNRRHTHKRAIKMLARVGLADRMHHKPAQLSGGQQQRVAIARALINMPGLLVADEPTGNLDSQSSEQILDLFADLRQEFGLTLIVVTHDPTVAARADRRLHLVDGRLVA